MKTILLYLILGAATITAAQIQAPNTQDALAIAKEVAAAETSRTVALTKGDTATLDRIMADEITYVHASGKVDTKQSYLEAIRSGQLHYISWQPKNLDVRVIGDAAIIKGEYAVRVTDSRVQPNPFDINIFILTVYARRDGHWQQIAWQSTRDPVAFRH